MKPSILFVVTGDYEAIKRKGVERLLYERDEGGFFRKVITVHPLAYKTEVRVLNDRHEVYDIGLDLIPHGGRSRVVMYAQTPIHFFRVIWTIVRLVKKHRVDMIRATDPYWMGLFGYLCAKICGIPHCVSIHVDYRKVMATNRHLTFCSVLGSYRLARLLERFVLSTAPMVMPYTETLGVEVANNGVKRAKIRVIPHGVDLSHFPRPTISLDSLLREGE